MKRKKKLQTELKASFIVSPAWIVVHKRIIPLIFKRKEHLTAFILHLFIIIVIENTFTFTVINSISFSFLSVILYENIHSQVSLSIHSIWTVAQILFMNLDLSPLFDRVYKVWKFIFSNFLGFGIQDFVLLLLFFVLNLATV